MTGLRERVKAQIAQAGPLGIADYMAVCLLDPADGYYTSREPFGTGGDFTTAPEISQMFGELLGVWLRAAWESAGRPDGAVLAELGPGRGTLIKDVCRTLRRLDSAWFPSLRIALVEASPRLAGIQRATLGPEAGQASWHASLAGLPDGPLFLIGNEFFDALPIRQYQRAAKTWRERLVGLDETGELALMLGPGSLSPALLPPEAEDQPDGAVFELSPAREAAMEEIAARLARNGGAALLLDYGHLAPGFGDTLQAVRRHRFEPVLAHPGEADLTTHVDFSALALVAHRHGLAASAATQGEFLLGLGLLERAGALGAALDAAGRERIQGEVERLAGPDAMGTLFKVLGVAAKGVALPALRPFALADRRGGP